MIWADLLPIVAVALILSAGLFWSWCSQLHIPAQPPCDCQACVDTALAEIERKMEVGK